MAQHGTRLMKVFVGGTDYSAEVSNARIVPAERDSDFVTFADAASGGARDYTFQGTVVQDSASGTFWKKMWVSAGSTVTVLLKPHGNTTASTSQPHYSGDAVIAEPDGDFIGGEANKSTSARHTVDFSWQYTAKPTELTS
jgi:hypothetical protein